MWCFPYYYVYRHIAYAVNNMSIIFCLRNHLNIYEIIWLCVQWVKTFDISLFFCKWLLFFLPCWQHILQQWTESHLTCTCNTISSDLQHNIIGSVTLVSFPGPHPASVTLQYAWLSTLQRTGSWVRAWEWGYCNTISFPGPLHPASVTCSMVQGTGRYCKWWKLGKGLGMRLL